MNINIPQMIVTLVNLLILFWIVKHFAFDRVNKILKDRKNLIEDTIKAEDDIKNQVVDLAMTISEKVLGESIDMNKHKELIDEYISKVGM